MPALFFLGFSLAGTAANTSDEAAAIEFGITIAEINRLSGLA